MDLFWRSFLAYILLFLLFLCLEILVEARNLHWRSYCGCRSAGKRAYAIYMWILRRHQSPTFQVSQPCSDFSILYVSLRTGMRKKSLKSVRLSSNMPALPCCHLLAFSQAKPLNSVRHYSVTRSLAQFQEADRLWLRSFHCWLAFNYWGFGCPEGLGQRQSENRRC